jgi:hypothetical protein
VTGVQTCALPIYTLARELARRSTSESGDIYARRL